jgi:hypothetical protein
MPWNGKKSLNCLLQKEAKVGLEAAVSKKNSNNGKGDKPRNCFSKKYKKNYDSINWGQKKSKELAK